MQSCFHPLHANFQLLFSHHRFFKHTMWWPAFCLATRRRAINAAHITQTHPFSLPSPSPPCANQLPFLPTPMPFLFFFLAPFSTLTCPSWCIFTHSALIKLWVLCKFVFIVHGIFWFRLHFALSSKGCPVLHDFPYYHTFDRLVLILAIIFPWPEAPIGFKLCHDFLTFDISTRHEMSPV